MNLLCVHLSDIHFRENNKLNYMNERIENISVAIKTQGTKFDSVFIFITGDIAFSGKKKEYDIAEKFIISLSEKIEVTYKIKPIIEIVPGNHDCDHVDEDAVREMVRKGITENENNFKVLQKMTECQKEFFVFYKNITNKEWDIKNCIFFENSYTIKNKSIDILLINSAWMAIKDEIPGTYLIPLESISPKSVSKADVAITLLHHPYNWFVPSNKRNLQKLLENNSDVIFFGHEHEYSGFKKINSDNGNIQYVEGSILQKDSFEKISGFNTLELDLDNKTCTSTYYEWDNKQNIYSIKTTKPFSLIQNPIRPNNTFTLSPSFSKYLNDLGMAFSHPDAESIELNQLFVYPNIRLIDKNLESFDKSLIKNNILDFILEKKKLVVLGPEKSGKTTLCKKIFVDLFDKGFKPILIDGKEIRNYDEKNIRKMIDVTYSNTYHSPSFEVFSQEPPNIKVLIIDNFENCRINEKQKCSLLETLNDQFDYIVLVGNINATFFGYLLENQIDFEKMNYVKCELLEFNTKKRAILTRNWVSLSSYLNIQDINRKSIETERILTNLIGRNFVPSYPLFILMILQQLESSRKVDPNLGDYGYLYESLITVALKKNSKPIFTIDVQLGFLSEFAYYLFINRNEFRLKGKLCVDRTSYYNFTQMFNKNQRLTLDSDQVLKLFIESSILEENGDISFKYSYIYYYFIGKYLSSHITEESIHAQIEEMVQKLHFSEFSDILIFLCYQSKVPYIAQTIISNSRTFFSTNLEFDIVEGSKQLVNSVENLPDIIEEIDKAEKVEEEDIASQEKLEIETTQDESTFDRDLSEMVQLNVAFKSINLMGLLLKNFPGTLPGEIKDELAKEICSLGLRILDQLFTSIEPTIRQFVEHKLGIIRENHKDWQIEKICSRIRDSLVGLLETSSFMCIKIISNSLGNELIDPILHELITTNTNNHSYKFIEISLKLDHYKNFPEREIFNLAEIIHKKPFSFYLLKYLVAYHYFILGIESSKKDSVFTRLGLKTITGLPGKIK